MRFRHKLVTWIVYPMFKVLAKVKYHAEVERFSGAGKRNWLIVSNHQTDFDQFFIGLSFPAPVYYVAMEDLFSNGWISKVIRWLVAPIPILKASTDLSTVRNCMKIAKEGGTIALFPEGNRTYSGKTCYIKPGVASLAKALGLPIAVYRIEGGYGVKPRWADKCRRGPMKAGVRRVIEPEEYKNMTKEELHSLICRELYVDETENRAEYKSRRSAEGLERVLYVCPDCGLSEFKTEKDTFSCMKCGKEYVYQPDMRIVQSGRKTRFSTVAEWYEYQETYVRGLDLSPYADTPVYSDRAGLYEIIINKKKILRTKNAEVSIFADRMSANSGAVTLKMDFDDIRAMACIAGHKLNIFYQDKVYQLKGGKHFNALRYCNIFYHAKFIKESHSDGEFQFLGL